jgi:hypothetical protein
VSYFSTCFESACLEFLPRAEWLSQSSSRAGGLDEMSTPAARGAVIGAPLPLDRGWSTVAVASAVTQRASRH